ncbi:MAG: PAS domain S-box protein [Acidobacteriia bacterium]|nr:PAS domain S-box protein [Terriglobia bacterium]
MPDTVKSRNPPDRRISAEPLGASEERYRALFEATHDGILIVDGDGRFVDVNESFCRILGASREHLIGTPFMDFIPPGRLADTVDALARLKAPPSMPVEFPLRALDGRLVELEWSSSSRYLPGLHFFSCRDITERKRAEWELLKSEARYRALVEATAQVVWTADGSGRSDEANQAWWSELTGQSSEQSEGWGWLEAVHPDDRERVKQTWTAALDTKSILRTEYRVRLCQSGYRHFTVRGVPVMNADGSFREWVGTFTDVTEQKSAENAIALSAAKLRAYFETASQGIVRVDEQGRIEELNARLLELCGYSREELIGKEVTILVPEELRKTYARYIAGFFRTPKSRPMGAGLELTARHKDGHEFPVEMGLSFVHTPEGVRALAFVSDITERKRSEAALRESQKLESLGVLAGGIAHDFNNLLVGIMGNASLLQTSPLAPAHLETVSEILKASQRAADLTRQLLAYAGKARFDMRPMNLSALVKEISALVHASIPKTVYVRLDLDENAQSIQADAGQIQQVVMNLVINGAEAIPPETPGVVVVSTREREIDEPYARAHFGENQLEPGRYVSLEIQDTGVGMDEATRLRIFDPFFTTKFMGRGLGLSAVLGIVRAHRGALRVESRPGEGSRFQIVFPAIRAAAPEPEQADWDEDLRGSGLILVVDDEPTIRRTAKMVLERYGYEVMVATDGLAAVELFQQKADEISLVLMDLTMPEMGGEETLRRLQSIRPDVRVILSSGYNEADVIQNFVGQRLAGFIQKPYNVRTLAGKIKAAMN